jgi:hypothetical protein
MIDSQACELAAQQVLSELEMYATIALVESFPSYTTKPRHGWFTNPGSDVD